MKNWSYWFNALIGGEPCPPILHLALAVTWGSLAILFALRAWPGHAAFCGFACGTRLQMALR